MSRKEKSIVAVTFAVLAMVFVVRMGWLNVSGLGLGALGATDNRLEEAQKKAEETRACLTREDEIRDLYAQTVSRQLPTSDTQKTPEARFDEDVAALCKQLGIDKPAISRGKREEIPDVADYEFITVLLKQFQPWPEVARLLKSFDENWFLIKELDILSPAEGGLLNADVHLARVVKISDEEKRKREAESGKQPKRLRVSAGVERKSVEQP